MVGEALTRDKNDGILKHIELGLNAITLSAHDIRPEKTGIHAELGIAFNGENIAYTVCNIKRSEERTKLCNSAYKFLGETYGDAATIIPKGDLVKQMNDFCLAVYPEYLSIQAPVKVEGAERNIGYTLKPHVLSGGGTIMYGKPGRGKSFTGLMMALAVNYGTNHYWNTEQGDTLYVNLERPSSTIPPRILGVAEALGLNSNSSLSVLNGKGATLVDIKDVMEEYIQENNTTFIVLDSISRAGTGDMKEDKVATATIDMLNKLGVSWLAIAHTPKYDETIYYGNSQYEAGADVMLRHSSKIIDDTGSIAVLLEVTKANDMPVPKPMGLHYSFNENGINGIRFAAKEETAGLIDKEKNLYSSLKDYLDEVGAKTATELAKTFEVERSAITDQLKIMFRNKELIATGLKENEKIYGLAKKED
jgi:hypothetical protein|tara:strand:- start:289 stop:1548 length:1260 start_codon:yes stop_codon:yes gene_type:complete